MSEDRLEKALEAMKNESVTPEEVAGVRARVWEKLPVPSVAACVEFQPKLKEYLEGGLAGHRRLLMEDHLSRCPDCRHELAALQGAGNVVAMPSPARRASWAAWRTWALVAAMVLAAVYVGRYRIDSLLAPGGPRATVAAVSGELYRLPEGAVQTGAAIGEGEVVRTGPASRAVLRLADGSLVEVNERSELFVHAAWTGQTIHLERGDVIVQAAKQHRGRLRVQTRDSVASVKGTVFAVSSGISGSVVSVIEGSVEVAQPGGEVLLTPGQQASSNPAVQTMSVTQAVAWSPDAEKYLALLGDFARLEKQLAAIPSAALRTEARLLRYLPANVIVYGAIPNLTNTIQQALALADQQAAESEAFREWWNSTGGKGVRELVDRMRNITPMLGEEIAYAVALSAPGAKDQVPLLLAEVLPGQRAALTQALDALRSGESTGSALAYQVTEGLMFVSDSPAHLQWALASLGQGAASPFAAEIAKRYQRGVGWLLGADFAGLGLLVQKPAEAAGLTGPDFNLLSFPAQFQMKHLFLEQRTAQGADENNVTLTFQGPRTGMAGWLATAGTTGAAEYISTDALVAFAASTREPRQLFEEMMAQLTKMDPRFANETKDAQTKLGIDFANDLASSFGTDFAIAMEPPLLPVPGWLLAVLVNSPGNLDAAIRKLVDAANSGIPLTGPDDPHRLIFVQEIADGRVWYSLRSGSSKAPFSWTYDSGYLVASSDRGVVLRAIATRHGGFPLIYTSGFRQQLPPSTGLHPSGFGWMNAGGALQGLAALAPSAMIQKLVSERDPILVVLNGETEQIRVASRTRITSLILDAMMLGFAGSHGASTSGPQTMARPRTRNDIARN